jgi:hypothetical protein
MLACLQSSCTHSSASTRSLIPLPRSASKLTFSSYEWFLSLDFDWDFISGKKRFRWPMVRLTLPLCSHQLMKRDRFSTFPVDTFCYLP